MTALRAAVTGSSGQGALVIGEVGQAHDGSLGSAHAHIDAIAGTGADAVKFQTHIAAAESTRREEWRVPFSAQDATRYEYWQRMEFTPEQWQGLRDHARDAGLAFISSPFSVEAVDLLHTVGADALKVASGEVTNAWLLDACIATGRPILISTGMSGFAEIDRAVERLRAGAAPFAVLQCSSVYPCPPDAVGLNVLAELRDRYGVPVGLSDHSGTIFPSLAAVTLGADVVEVHVALSRDAFGPDVSSSLLPDQLATVVEGVRAIEAMAANPVAKDDVAAELEPMRRLFTRSVVARRPLAAGTVLTEADLALKKPGDGLPPDALSDLIGARLVRDLEPDEALRLEDVEVGS